MTKKYLNNFLIFLMILFYLWRLFILLMKCNVQSKRFPECVQNTPHGLQVKFNTSRMQNSVHFGGQFQNDG